jgi:hypothetical protein
LASRLPLYRSRFNAWKAPGKVERREFEYKRHGTQTLIAAFNVTTGEVEGVVGNTRTERDFAWHRL